VITLLIDGLIAVAKTFDRALTAVEQGVRHRFPPRAVDDVQPAGAGTPPSAAGTGGHPIRSTSELLTNAVTELDFAYPNGKHAVIWVLQAELADRAAQFKAVGD
jgi:hypothetical protein